jgi:CubicO group peptidase (beta-lactamase class C family)
MRKRALEELDELFQKYNQGKTPGIAVLVMQDLEVIFKKAYGLKNLSENSYILPSSNFNLASVSKLFTGMAIALLEKEHYIQSKDKLKKFFPEISVTYSTIQIKHLIHHMSGLPNYAKRHWDEKKIITNEQIISYLKEDELNFLPGDRFEYNDTGYILLASLIEKVTSTSYSDFLIKYIFLPSKMKNTTVYYQNGIFIPERVLGYTEWPFFELDDEYPGDFVYGDGGIYSSLDDLHHLILAIENERILTSEIKEKILNYALNNSNQRINYGYGWYIDKYRGIKEYNNSGEWTGFRNHIASFPEINLWIIILANSNGTQARAISNKIADIFLE